MSDDRAKRTLKTTVWHFVYLSVSVSRRSPIQTRLREDRFSRILEWTWLVIKNMYNLFKFTIISLQDDSFDKMIGYWQFSTWLRARDSDSQTFASEVYCSKKYTGRYLLEKWQLKEDGLVLTPQGNAFAFCSGRTNDPFRISRQPWGLGHKPLKQVRDWNREDKNEDCIVS